MLKEVNNKKVKKKKKWRGGNRETMSGRLKPKKDKETGKQIQGNESKKKGKSSWFMGGAPKQLEIFPHRPREVWTMARSMNAI